MKERSGALSPAVLFSMSTSPLTDRIFCSTGIAFILNSYKFPENPFAINEAR